MANTPLYFLPGLLEDADGFEKQIEHFRAQRTCAVADLTRSETMPGLAKDALAAAPEGRFVLIGHSMGGYVALEVMRQAPERVERLALLNTHARPDSAESTENRRRLMALAEKDFPAVIEALLPKLVRPEHLGHRSGKITEMALGVGKEAFLRQERAIIGRIDSRPHLGAIRCPTLVVAGREDQIMPVEWLEELARGIPGARLEVIEECGHMASMEQPGKVTDVLAGWLQ